jgi:uncharacterized membrane protein YoaK (UPF0700 family)
LQGLFTAHVTGNFVTIGAALVFGTSGVVAKLLALPVFCMVVIVTRLVSSSLPARWPVLETILTLKLLLLLVAAVLAIAMGPFATGDGAPAIIVGMTLVSAMAIQNAVHRIHLGAAPPTTIMTGTTTQMMIDIADMIRGVPGVARDAIRSRLGRMCVGSPVGGMDVFDMLPEDRILSRTAAESASVRGATSGLRRPNGDLRWPMLRTE